MQKFFPSFRINQLQDGSGRLYWRGKVQPMGEGGMVWDLMLIYKNDHHTHLRENMVVLFKFFLFNRDLKTSHRR